MIAECNECGEHHSQHEVCRSPEEIMNEVALSDEQAVEWRRTQAQMRSEGFERQEHLMRNMLT